MPEGRHPPPEKQLLNLIEQGKQGKDIQPGTRARKFGLLSLFSIGGLKGRYSFYKNKPHQSLDVQPGALNIKGLNRILELAVLGLAVYLISNFAIAARNLRQLPQLDIKVPTAAEQQTVEVPSLLKKLPYYLEVARARDMFNPVTKEKIEEAQLTEEEIKAKSKIEETQAVLSLTGIGVSATGEPDAMIKDSERDKVYFLKRGDTVRDFKVEAIFKDSVVLSYEGKELILK
jgi:hypothetical protein